MDPVADALQLATFEQLVNEIGKRSQAAIVATIVSRTSSEDQTCTHYRGGLVPCLGLAQASVARLSRQCLENSEHTHD